MRTLHFTFHSVLKPEDPGYNHLLTCQDNRLRKILSHLQNSGFQVVSCRNFLELRESLRNLATISFDDGYRDGYSVALPILKEFGVAATFFITTCTIEDKLPPNAKFTLALRVLGIDRVSENLRSHLRGTTYEDLLTESFVPRVTFWHDPLPLQRLKTVFNHYLPIDLRQAIADDIFAEVLNKEGKSEKERCRATYLSVDELKGLEKAGMEVASHAATHAMLQNRSPEEVEKEIGDSLITLQNALGKQPVPVNVAWPYDGDGLIPTHLKGVAAKFQAKYWTIYLQGQLPSTDEVDTFLIRRVDHSLFEKVFGI